MSIGGKGETVHDPRMSLHSKYQRAIWDTPQADYIVRRSGRQKRPIRRKGQGDHPYRVLYETHLFQGLGVVEINPQRRSDGQKATIGGVFHHIDGSLTPSRQLSHLPGVLGGDGRQGLGNRRTNQVGRDRSRCRRRSLGLWRGGRHRRWEGRNGSRRRGRGSEQTQSNSK